MASRRPTSKRKDDDDDDDHGDRDRDVARNRRKSDNAVAAGSGGAGDQDVSWLEAELEKVNLELRTVRNERDKQRQQLAGLGQENDQLTRQQEQRIKRSQLQSQQQDLERSVRKKTAKKQRSVEDLEQSKSRRRQLHKTTELLEQGVQSILTRSYYYDQKDNKTEEGKLRTQKRQELLKGLLSEELKMKLLTGSVSNSNLDASRSHRNVSNHNYADEDDDIHDGEEDLPMVSLFADKNKRLDSGNSEMSDNDYLQQAESAPVYRVPSAASAGNRSSRSRSRSRSRKTKSTGRSPSTGSRRGRSNSRDRGSTRSNASSQRNKSQNSRRGGKRPNKNAKAEEVGDDHINHSTSNKSKDSGLASMLESSRSRRSDGDESDDTPKTANTNG